MALPILICDDSNMARKQVKKSLPADWDVDISMATNGQEAVDILRSKEIGVLFLDLTMPVLDGVGVLEVVKKDQMDCFVVVISADIQPEMKKKVMSLGALAFIQKPVNAEKLHEILKLYGLI
ncbi:response regulator [Flocculibacter collagenilyticus]|uniref:response regulator n=1 Tax=Flocculibacter collagenilyticus TaxID=2744479 RepID=UPI0018F52793|nr:response regulator [Flocculibacter collagenilyticus]